MMANQLKTILYVEDDPDILTIAKVALEKVGDFDVQACSSGVEALAILEAYRPDLIILDVMMPDMDGPETLRRIRKIPELVNTPVIFLTAKVQRTEVVRYKEMGAVEVIPKPFDPMTLAQTISEIWSGVKHLDKLSS